MPSINPPTAPFSDADFERLDDLLWEGAVPRDGMNLEAVDGFYSAMFVAPVVVTEIDEFLPAIWGGGDAPFPEAERNEELRSLLSSYWRAVGRRIAQTNEDDAQAHIPAIQLSEELFEAVRENRIDELEDDTPYGADWAAGFEYGMYLQQEAWDLRLEADPDLEDALSVIFALAEPDDEMDEGDLEDDLADDDFETDDAFSPAAAERESGALEAPLAAEPDTARIEQLMLERGVPQAQVNAALEEIMAVARGDVPSENSPEMRTLIRDACGGSFDGEEDEDDDGMLDEDLEPLTPAERLQLILDLPGVLQTFHFLRLEEQKPQPARRDNEIGRNDPCPCGSGKKYKKCHGSPDALH